MLNKFVRWLGIGLIVFLLAASLQAQQVIEAPAGIRAAERWSFSADGGKSWSRRPPLVRVGQAVNIAAKTAFDVPDPSASRWWALTHYLPARSTTGLALNGEPIPLPLKGMRYKTIPAIGAKLLKRGRNILTGTVRVDNSALTRYGRPARDVRFALPAGKALLTIPKLAFQTGPILGAFGSEHFTVACRTTIPAKVTLTVTETRWEANWRPDSPRKSVHKSPAGLFHRFRAPKHLLASGLEYRLTASAGKETAATETFAFSLPVFGGKG
ncbi:hypothetical protein LCGC14_2010690, partial [marine sediment metagenome]